MNYLNEDITSSEFRERFLAMRSKVRGADVSLKKKQIELKNYEIN